VIATEVVEGDAEPQPTPHRDGQPDQGGYADLSEPPRGQRDQGDKPTGHRHSGQLHLGDDRIVVRRPAAQCHHDAERDCGEISEE
jgi:hypothetical protein